jgi:ABC-type transport system involved in multi-copper enzyme maturation permease subunit
MKAIVTYILLTAFRDRLFFGLLVAVYVATAICIFLGGLPLLENRESAVSYMAAAIRIIGIIGMVVFACFHVRQAFENKEIDVFVTRPLRRSQLVVAYALGFVVVSLVFISIAALPVVWYSYEQWQGLLAWMGSLILEQALIITFALFAAFTFSSATLAVITTLGIYTLCRMSAYFMFMVENMRSRSEGVMEWMGNFLYWISMMFPRFDYFAPSRWLVYGLENSTALLLAITQVAIYFPLLLTATILDFRKRQF